MKNIELLYLTGTSQAIAVSPIIVHSKHSLKHRTSSHVTETIARMMFAATPRYALIHRQPCSTWKMYQFVLRAIE